MSRTTALIILFLLPITVACDKVALLAPNESTITLSVNTTTLALNGTAEVRATVIEPAGTPVHNGTEVTFTSTVGTMDPPTSRTEGGVARSTFRANTQSGTAQITAFSGGARVAEPVEIRVGTAAAETVRIRTEPASVPATGGTVQVIAAVVDAAGNPLPSVQVIFSSDGGTLQSTSATTDALGEARTSITTNRQTVVRAQVAGKEATATIAVVALPTVGLTASTTTPAVGVPMTFTVTPTAVSGGNPIANVTFNPGDGSPTQNLGAISNAQTISHRYDSAGPFTATAEVRDTAGQTNRAQVTVTAQRGVPTVTISGPQQAIQVGDVVNFSVTATAATGGPPIERGTITFPDGSATFGPGTTNFPRSFSTPGTFVIRATVQDAAGTTASAEFPVTVRQRPAIEVTLDADSGDGNPSFVCNPPRSSPVYPKTCTVTVSAFAPSARVVFTAGFSGTAPNNIASYVWDFDDGSPPQTTTNRNIDRVFTTARTYVVTVKVNTTDGAQGSQRLNLIVQNAIFGPPPN